MNKYQRIRRMLTAFLPLLMIAFYIVPISAEGTDVSPTLQAGEVSASRSTTVEVDIVMHGNPGIISMQLDISYDASVLTLVKVTDGELIGQAAHSDDFSLCPYRLTWVNDLAQTNYTDNGIIATLTFSVSADAAAGTYPVTISYTRNNFEIFNCNAEEVEFDTVSGSITVVASGCDHASKTEVPAKDADCTNAGNLMYFVCDICGQFLKSDGLTATVEEAEALPALGHDYGEGWHTDTEQHWYTCSRCNIVEEEEAHLFSADAPESACTVCGFIPQHVHTLTKAEPTVHCTAPGNTAYYFCECGKWFFDPEGISEILDRDSIRTEPLGHTDTNHDQICDTCHATGITASTPENSPENDGDSGVLVWIILTLVSVCLIAGMCLIALTKRHNKSKSRA